MAGPRTRGRTLALSIAALGVVYGDIGTSPLYAVRECFHGPHAAAATEGNILGVLSLIFWALVLVISIKYMAYILRANHGGEGGILALTALAVPARDKGQIRPGGVFLVMGLFGAALLYGESMITPSISVLSAVEGLQVVAPSLKRFVLPVTIAILVLLFWFQRRGTAKVGAIFGPITFSWFIVLGSLGLYQILQGPRVLYAFNPAFAVGFFLDNGLAGFVVLGAVFLVVTGGETMYADLGHFGTRPIRLMWFIVALPALLLNYFGQGALALRAPESVENLFFLMAPSWARIPLVLMSTCATVIASQAVISGAFSLSRQAVMMGYLPRLRIEHTSAHEIGQIYVPGVNWALMLATVAVVLGFRTSSNVAAAYGIAVTSTMAITTLLAFRVAYRRWRWPVALAILVTLPLLCIDFSFLGANLFKLAGGGWVPLAVASGVLLVMLTWKRGRGILASRLAQKTERLSDFMGRVRAEGAASMTRVPGTAVYMVSTPEVVPHALMYTLKHQHVVHERVVILTIQTDDTPHVPLAERAFIEPLGKGFWRVTAVYGFMETPDVPQLLAYLPTLEPQLEIDLDVTTFFLGHETVMASEQPGMARWRENLFSFMARNSTKATRFFGLPTDRVIEVGAYVEI